MCACMFKYVHTHKVLSYVSAHFNISLEFITAHFNIFMDLICVVTFVVTTTTAAAVTGIQMHMLIYPKYIKCY